jgi:HK97 family phage portal protein
VNTIETEDIAARLHAMTDTTAFAESRSLENPATPVSAEQLASLIGYGPTRSGVQINEQTALTYSAVFGAVRILSESVGMLPLAVFRGDDDEDVKIRAKDHPAYPLLRWEPNPEMTATAWKEAEQANLTLWGNCYARVIEGNDGTPKQILPLLSDRTHVERVAGQLRYKVEGGGGSFAPEEIIHIPGLSLNGLNGLTPIGYAREAVALGKAAEIFGATFFGNGATVAGVLEVPGTLKPEQKAELRESWQAMHGGSGNSFKTAVLQAGTKFNRIGIPPEDAQFLETRKFQVTEIARVYRIPPHMLGDLERATNANIEHQSLEFLIYTLAPWLEKWESELTRKLCGTSGEYHVKFDDSRLLRTDITARQQFYSIGRQWGFLNADEIRAREGLAPLPNGQGQTYYSPVNMVPSDKFKDMPTPGTTPPPPPGDDGNDNPPHPNKGDVKARAVEAVRLVFADAIQRMQRKEANARGRNKADEKFYAEHRQHVLEAITPAAVSLLTLLGKPATTMPMPMLESFAAVRGSESPALNLADDLIASLLNEIGD